MSEIRTAKEAIEAAAQYHEDLAKVAEAAAGKVAELAARETVALGAEILSIQAKAKRHWSHADAIRALPVAEAADDEALVEIVALALQHASAQGTGVPCAESLLGVAAAPILRDYGRAVLAALRAARALR